MVQVLIDNVTYYLLQWFLERTMEDIEAFTPGGNQDAVKMCSMKKCFAMWRLGDSVEH